MAPSTAPAVELHPSSTGPRVATLCLLQMTAHFSLTLLVQSLRLPDRAVRLVALRCISALARAMVTNTAPIRDIEVEPHIFAETPQPNSRITRVPTPLTWPKSHASNFAASIDPAELLSSAHLSKGRAEEVFRQVRMQGQLMSSVAGLRHSVEALILYCDFVDQPLLR